MTLIGERSCLPDGLVESVFWTIPPIVEVRGAGRGLLRLSPGEVLWALERASCRSEQRGDCLWWRGYCRNGYGTLSIRDSPVYLHVLAYVIVNGPVAKAHEICHSCDNRPCWKPSHLFAGTRQENVADMWRKGRAVRPPRTSGLAQHLARLSDQEAADIRSAWATGDQDQRTIAAAFGCSQSTVWRIIHGRVRGG